MKWRNQLLALVCLLVFLALGVLYFKNWVVQKPFGIILFVGEGLDATRLAATRIYAADADTPLALDSLSYSALLKNASADSIAPDAAAAATAFACGVKVKNGSLGMSAGGKALVNLIELARKKGRMTGLVTDVQLTDATAAAFYAHSKSHDAERLARQLVHHDGIDVVLGGGAAEFRPPNKGGTRSDGADLVVKLQDAGYEFIETSDALEDVPRWRRAKLFGLFGSNELAYADDDVARADQPGLAEMVRHSIELLQFNRGGYLLIVDAGLMRKAAELNDADRTLLQTIELDRAVSVALEYAGVKSLVIVAGDVGVGGLTMSGFAPRRASGGIWWGADPNQDGPWLTWATGPNGRRTSPTATASETPFPATPDDTDVSPEPGTIFEPAAAYSERARETIADVVALGSGPGAEALHGIIESTRVFEIIDDKL